MKAMLLSILTVAALAAGAAHAQSGAEVAKAKGCLNCHDVEKKKMGPAFKDVAAKYKGDSSAEGAVIAKLKSGKGHPKVNATDAELKAAVGFALGGK